PGYLKKRRGAKSPDDLASHDCLLFDAGPGSSEVRLTKADRSARVVLTPRMLAGDMEILHAAAVGGLGIALVPAFQCMDDLRARRLERVLRDWSAPPTPIHVVYPTARYVSPKARAFIDYLQQRMTPPPWELGPAP